MDSPTKQWLYNLCVGRFWFNGKGVLVPVLLVISLFLVGGMAILLESHPLVPDRRPVADAIYGGLILLIGGSATWFVGRDFIKVDGRRVEVDLDNRFLFFKMKFLGMALFAIGILALCYGIYLAMGARYFI